MFKSSTRIHLILYLPHVGSELDQEPFAIQTSSVFPIRTKPTAHSYTANVTVPFEEISETPLVSTVNVGQDTVNEKKIEKLVSLPLVNLCFAILCKNYNIYIRREQKTYQNVNILITTTAHLIFKRLLKSTCCKKNI